MTGTTGKDTTMHVGRSWVVMEEYKRLGNVRPGVREVVRLRQVSEGDWQVNIKKKDSDWSEGGRCVYR